MGAVAAETPPAPIAAAVRGSAFGIDIFSSSPLEGLPASIGRGRVHWHVLDDDSLRALWDRRPATRVVDVRYSSGRTFLGVDRGGDGSFRIVTPRHGRHVVAPDGAEIWSALPASPPARWQRLLYAQPLPLAAGLQGRELFHASGVLVGGRTIALVAPSGTGKTSIAAHLVAAGAGFVTDDVLALDLTSTGVVAYPGPARIAVTAKELRAIPRTSRRRLGPVVGRTDKVIVAPTHAAPPRPLGALAFLSRRSEHRVIRIAEATAPSPQRLLGSAFLPYLDRPERLLQRLELCAAVRAGTPCLDVEIPQSASAADVAAALLEHLERS